MNLRLNRELIADGYTLGTMYLDGDFLGYTCEDTDRHLEIGGEKVYGQTAIPRGQYPVVVSWSQRFGKYLPEVVGVRQFVGVRIHGGNTAADTLGCILLGSKRTVDGVRECAAINKHLMEMLGWAEQRKEPVTLTVE